MQGECDRRLPELTLAGLHESLAERVLQLSEIRFETPILDIGCGSGAWLARLARHGFKRLHGVDNQSFTTFPPADETGAGFSCSYADLDNDPDLGLGTAAFGLITAIEVIEHVHNPGRFFSHAARHLADNGYFLITTPNLHSVRARLRFALTGKLQGFDPTNVPAEPTHLYPVFLTCLDRLLARYQMEAVQRWTFPPRGGTGTRLMGRFAAGVLEMVLPNDYPGDSLCVLVRRR
jgi:2-polyprenyl-3-methyl-5-hydroxy-6-metoxy-1,4-benzoquinol methylase